MSRIRTIKPEFWTHEKVVKLPFEARLMFVGMWNFADDDGYLSDEPESIRLQILPSDEIDAWATIDLLVASDLLERIVIDSGSLLHIKGFDKHQQVSHKTATKFPVSSGRKQIIPAHVRREIASKYGCQAGETKDVECYFCGSPGKIYWPRLHNGKPCFWVGFSEVEIDHIDPESSGGLTETENLVLSCRYCNRQRGNKSAEKFLSERFQRPPDNSGSLRPESNRIEGNLRELKETRASAYSIFERDFDNFWDKNPNKVGKGAAKKAFKAALTHATLLELMAGLDRYVRDKPPDRPWCNPATWLNQDRWMDQPAVAGKMNGHASAAKVPGAPLVFVAEDSPQWDAWDAFYRTTKGTSPPKTNRGHTFERGWHFPTEWPPEPKHDPA